MHGTARPPPIRPVLPPLKKDIGPKCKRRELILINKRLAKKIYRMLMEGGIDARLDDQGGFDHGLFVPLKIMYPDAQIPCVQLSLVSGLDPGAIVSTTAAAKAPCNGTTFSPVMGK